MAWVSARVEIGSYAKPHWGLLKLSYIKATIWQFGWFYVGFTFGRGM